jgi:flagellar biosynthesis protein FlhA
MATNTKRAPTPSTDPLKGKGDLAITGGLLSFLVIMIAPVPPAVMDLLIAVSISMSLLILLVTFYVEKPVQFSVFPLLLLGTTLFRLSLNVASTRLILLHGAEGEAAAGSIIQTFGQVVVGGSYLVGMVVFTILVVINFMVVTKGAGRVAEVAARFTLDAMPGKQMAIDAELNAGLIDEKTARRRRGEISREADFYGAMDGASKFIRGDAVAGILITVVNIIAGLLIGVVQGGLGVVEALEIYTVLTIGDGLIGQIPALIISAAAGMLVTRVSNDDGEDGLHGQLSAQLLNDRRPLALLSGALIGFMMVPGLRLPFFLLGGAAGYAAWKANGQAAATPQAGRSSGGASEGDEPGAAKSSELPVEMLLRVEPLAIELGVELLALVDERKGGDLVERIQRIRRQIVTDLGLLVPAVHLRDNLRLESGEYRILMRGEEIGRGTVIPRKVLAINPGNATGGMKGVETTDPVFGLPAWWIQDKQRLRAQARGYTVVDIPTVITTHLTELLQQSGHELFGLQQLAGTLERVTEDNPRLIEDLVPDQLSRSTVLRVFRNLLREGVSVRDSQTIFEALADNAIRVKDADLLTEFVRQRLSRHITRRFTSPEGVIHYIGLAPDAEDALTRGLRSEQGGQVNLSLDPEEARQLLTGLRDAAEAWTGEGSVVILCPPLARGPLRRLAEKIIPRIPILSPGELLPAVRLQRVAAVSLRPSGARRPRSST